MLDYIRVQSLGAIELTKPHRLCGIAIPYLLNELFSLSIFTIEYSLSFTCTNLALMKQKNNKNILVKSIIHRHYYRLQNLFEKRYAHIWIHIAKFFHFLDEFDIA